MLSIKAEVLIYIAVACLTLLGPCIGYFVLGDHLASLSEEALRNGKKFEDLSRSIGEGKTQINKDSASATMHLLAQSQKTLSDMFLRANSSVKHILNSIIVTAIFQFFMLIFIFLKRKNKASHTSEMPPVSSEHAP
jgi:predicted PurR-regulated permease PerM